LFDLEKVRNSFVVQNSNSKSSNLNHSQNYCYDECDANYASMKLLNNGKTRQNYQIFENSFAKIYTILNDGETRKNCQIFENSFAKIYTILPQQINLAHKIENLNLTSPKICVVI
jgi:hypothetical protein